MCMRSWWRLGAATLQVTAMAALVFGLASGSEAAPPSYSAAEIRGRVVDAETKQPLEGVHVVAQWRLATGLIEAHRVTRLQILETVTDAHGEYYLPPWGPKPRPLLSELEWGFDPILTFFKVGYRPDTKNNYSPPPDNEAELSQRFSLWNGKTIALEPFRGTAQEWATYLSGVQNDLGWGHTGAVLGTVNDYWKQMPRVVLAIAGERRRLPGLLRYRVQDLETWNATEAQLQALIKPGGATR
jgi:hypothetical protein